MSLKRATFTSSSDPKSLYVEGLITHIAVTAPADTIFSITYNKSFTTQVKIPSNGFFELDSKVITIQKVDFSKLPIGEEKIIILYQDNSDEGGMEELESSNAIIQYIQGPPGKQGIPGKQGPPGKNMLAVGDTQPTDADIYLWIDTGVD